MTAASTTYSTDAAGWREHKPAKEDHAVEDNAVGDRISTNMTEKNKRRSRWTRCMMSWIRKSKEKPFEDLKHWRTLDDTPSLQSLGRLDDKGLCLKMRALTVFIAHLGAVCTRVR